ncbi:TIGR03936 family radical SAM-associated protein [Ornithinimicrobium pratense]
MRFTSTRDFQRALERAVRKAGLPMAYSAGFHPHPKISYANAAPTGAASEAEFVEISLTRSLEPGSVRAGLDAALPEGLDVLEVSDAADLPGALADHLQGSLWALRFRAAEDVPGREAVGSAVEAFRAIEELHVTRMMKKGPRELDVRAAVVTLAVADDTPVEVPAATGDVVVLATVRHTTPTVRPEEIWGALRQVGGLGLPRPVSTRLRQGPLRGNEVAASLTG